MSMLKRFWKDEAGVTSIEYGLIAGTTALILVAVLPSLEAALNNQYSTIASAM